MPSMTMNNEEAALLRMIRGLDAQQRQQAEDYVRSLSGAPRRGSPEAVLSLFGVMSPEEAQALQAVIAEGCENIDDFSTESLA